MVTTTTSPTVASRRASKKLPAPMAPSPWIHTITGRGWRGPAARGAVTLRHRQSSATLATWA
jgi:hypothetical protein